MDSHRRSPITCVAVSSDAGKVLSGDASGTVILSTVIFDTGEFCHSFLFEGVSSIAALEFFDESAVVDNGLQLTVIGIASCSASRILNSRTERAIVIGIHCTDSFVYLVEKSKICKYSRSLLDFTVIPADEVVGESCGITSAEWSSDGTKLAALSSCIVFVMYDLIHSQVLWRATLSNHLRSFVVDFCIDTDDSIYYITRHRGVHRVGISSVPKSLAEKGNI
ncbi:hypothetical protein OESDEN_02179 [Oesophagostomum dentatum]|uniref:Uncharacterized protein n=1 Tax=Oesophagostomum dentatum TaxID=61180 RepID=A0A0B1TKQ2_OESDE|nr:hypothetical protein OESDEN_02179 [Oesophagostomum dentatum]